jgi:hypothetical protein
MLPANRRGPSREVHKRKREFDKLAQLSVEDKAAVVPDMVVLSRSVRKVYRN